MDYLSHIAIVYTASMLGKKIFDFLLSSSCIKKCYDGHYATLNSQPTEKYYYPDDIHICEFEKTS